MEFNHRAMFKDGYGKEVDGALAIPPLFCIKNHKTIFLGTSFFIGRELLITAKHCLFDNSGKELSQFFISQFLPNRGFVIRPIFKFYYNHSDIAVLLAVPMSSPKTGEKLSNPCLRATLKRPAIGSKIVSFAYPKTTVVDSGKNCGLRIEDMWHYGFIEDFHQEGTPLLRHSCYQSNMQILGGSSGGPVLSENGSVFAINSTGSDVTSDIEPYSFLTPFHECLDIEIDGMKGEKYSIQFLIDNKQFPFDY